MKRMRLLLIINIVLALIIGSVYVGTDFARSADQSKVIQLSYAGTTPTRHFRTIFRDPEWIKRIEKATNGRVRINYYPSETILKGNEVFHGVQRGVADIGGSAFAYNPGICQFMELFDYPGIVNATNANIVANVGRDVYNKFKPTELDNLKILWWEGAGICGMLITRKPIRSLDDVKGMKIRGTGISIKALQALGATPVALGVMDVYMSMQKGAIDGALFPPETLQSFRLSDFAKYATYVPWVYSVNTITCMNIEKWKSLPPDIQQIFDKLDNEFMGWANDLVQEQQVLGVSHGKKTGVEFILFSPEDTAKGIKLVSYLANEQADPLEAKGLPAKEGLSYAKERSNYFNKIYPTLDLGLNK